MKVKAKSKGFYRGVLHKPGDVFDIASEKDLGKWMEVVAPRQIEKPAQEVKPVAGADKAEEDKAAPAAPANEVKAETPTKQEPEKPAQETKPTEDKAVKAAPAKPKGGKV